MDFSEIYVRIFKRVLKLFRTKKLCLTIIELFKKILFNRFNREMFKTRHLKKDISGEFLSDFFFFFNYISKISRHVILG